MYLKISRYVIIGDLPLREKYIHTYIKLFYDIGFCIKKIQIPCTRKNT